MYMYICTYIYICIYMYMYICTYIYIYYGGGICVCEGICVRVSILKLLLYLTYSPVMETPKGTIAFHNCRLDFSGTFMIHMRIVNTICIRKEEAVQN